MKSQLGDVENRFLRKCDNFLFEWIIMLVAYEQEICSFWEGMCNYINSTFNFKEKKQSRNCGINLSLLSVLQYLRQLVRKYNDSLTYWVQTMLEMREKYTVFCKIFPLDLPKCVIYTRLNLESSLCGLKPKENHFLTVDTVITSKNDTGRFLDC